MLYFYRKPISLIFISILFITISVHSIASAPVPSAPEINAESAILIDAATGKVLYEKNADKPIPPASMTKLMTIHTALKFINDGSADADALVPVSAAADFRSLPPRSSLMFIEEGQRVTLLELLQGLALPSGNDAGIAVAEYLAGSVDNFVALMNAEAGRLGLSCTHFDDSSGLSEKNITTARDFASFCRIYIEDNSRYISGLHLPMSFTYPKPENLSPQGSSVHGPITQPNHNLLIGRMAGVDGLKTGYIDESGYNFAATAVTAEGTDEERRLILVSMGGPGKSSYDGSLRRVIDAAVLLSYGFYGWAQFTPAVPTDETVELRGAAVDSLRVAYSPAAEMLIETALLDELEFVPFYRIPDVSGLPVDAGALIGRWELVLHGETLQSGIITAAESVEKGNIFKRIAARFGNRKN